MGSFLSCCFGRKKKKEIKASVGTIGVQTDGVNEPGPASMTPPPLERMATIDEAPAEGHMNEFSTQVPPGLINKPTPRAAGYVPRPKTAAKNAKASPVVAGASAEGGRDDSLTPQQKIIASELAIEDPEVEEQLKRKFDAITRAPSNRDAQRTPSPLAPGPLIDF